MADNTKIEWTDATWNIITGCSVVSPGCTNCYAMRLAGTRLKNHESRKGLTRPSKARGGEAEGRTGKQKSKPVWTGEVRFNEQWLTQPLTWKRPRRIFVAAHGDLFADGVKDEWLDRIFAVMALCPQHTFQVLTKRPERMREYMRRQNPRNIHPSMNHVAAIGETGPRPPALDLRNWPLPNVWLGVSVEDQKRADERIPLLLDTPAALRWISAEPLLGPIDFYKTSAVMPLQNHPWRNRPILGGIHWIVAGGESGPDARPMHPDWVRALRDQCAAAGVPFNFKQWGSWKHGSDFARDAKVVTFDGRVIAPDLEALGEEHRQSPFERGTMMRRVGKSAAGRLLDGVQHDAFPEARP